MARGAGSVTVRLVRDGGETANVYESDLKFENEDEFEGLRSDKKKLLEDDLLHEGDDGHDGQPAFSRRLLSCLFSSASGHPCLISVPTVVLRQYLLRRHDVYARVALAHSSPFPLDAFLVL
jgi:hypothetical protein